MPDRQDRRRLIEPIETQACVDATMEPLTNFATTLKEKSNFLRWILWTAAAVGCGDFNSNDKLSSRQDDR